LIGRAHGLMERGGHGLPKVSPRTAMPFSSTPCGRATPETALEPFQGWPACRASGLRSSSTPLDTSRHTSKEELNFEVPFQVSSRNSCPSSQCTQWTEICHKADKTCTVFHHFTKPSCTVRPAGGHPWLGMLDCQACQGWLPAERLCHF
jgi:hypothetical protein